MDQSGLLYHAREINAYKSVYRLWNNLHVQDVTADYMYMYTAQLIIATLVRIEWQQKLSFGYAPTYDKNYVDTMDIFHSKSNTVYMYYITAEYRKNAL